MSRSSTVTIFRGIFLGGFLIFGVSPLSREGELRSPSPAEVPPASGTSFSSRQFGYLLRDRDTHFASYRLREYRDHLRGEHTPPSAPVVHHRPALGRSPSRGFSSAVSSRSSSSRPVRALHRFPGPTGRRADYYSATPCIVLETVALAFKSIYTKITDHWRTINNVEELEIMTKNMNNVHVIAKIYALWCFFGMEFFLAIPVSYPLLDYVIPMENRTRVVAFPCYVEYGLDPQKYYYPLMTQGFFGSLGCVAVFAAFDLSYMMLTSYVIGLFALAK
ncbi:unnamed protein product [Trichogramma brassicae]|uniref:Uncharacterized protein n=1 Tax=Trichogramma brassicae TaxID=86971 RepID=A0A6H5J5K3_9HYME|nr:unnamed protein product [Trichogramma brassicae]